MGQEHAESRAKAHSKARTRKKSWHAGQAWQLLQPPSVPVPPILHLSSSYLQSESAALTDPDLISSAPR